LKTHGGDWYKVAAHSASVTAQAYHYFGLLHDVFAKFPISIRAADFVEYFKDAGRKVVTLRKLGGTVDQIWKENKEYFTYENAETIRTMLSNALGEAEKIHYTSNLENMVCLSIQTLARSLGKFFTLELTSIIEAGGVPLVKLTRNGRDIFTVDVVEYKFGRTFTAISDKTLPPCQLEFIYTANV
jgi:hypothetical protein